jgi:hypothetical protein
MTLYMAGHVPSLGEMFFCLQRYNCLLNDFLSGCMPSMIMKFCQSRISDDTLRSANFLTELIYCRDNVTNGLLSRDEIDDIICDICIS